MKMTVPTTCKQHPESQAVITIRTPKGDAPYRLRRHWCGELNCNIPLGWQYRTRTGHITTDAGACEHPEVLQDLQCEDYDQRTTASGVFFTLAMAATGASLMAVKLLNGALPIAATALLLAAHRHIRRKKNRPLRPEWNGNNADQETNTSANDNPRGEQP